jgi:hypothetical protein
LISVICGGLTFVVLLILGIPFAGLIALFVGLADLVPLVGATLGGAVAVLAGFLHSTTAGIVVLVFFVVYQQLENHLLQPLIFARTVKLNPLAVIVAILLGVELLGVLGALLAIPVAGMIQVILRDVWDHRRGRLKEEPTVGEERRPAGAPDGGGSGDSGCGPDQHSVVPPRGIRAQRDRREPVAAQQDGADPARHPLHRSAACHRPAPAAVPMPIICVIIRSSVTIVFSALPADQDSGPGRPAGTTRTGQRAWCRRALATLPSSNSRLADRPLEPTTMTAASRSAAWSARAAATARALPGRPAQPSRMWLASNSAEGSTSGSPGTSTDAVSSSRPGNSDAAPAAACAAPGEPSVATSTGPATAADRSRVVSG